MGAVNAASADSRTPSPQSVNGTSASPSVSQQGAPSKDMQQKATNDEEGSPQERKAESKPAKPVTISPVKNNVTDIPFEEWENNVIEEIFDISVRPNVQAMYASSLRQDLEDAQAPIRLTAEMLDQVILARVNSQLERAPFEYLLGCWRRAAQALRSLRQPPDPQKARILLEAKRFCTSYITFCITMPDIFENANAGTSLAQQLLQKSEDELPPAFLDELIARSVENDSLEDVFGPAIGEIASQLGNYNIGDTYQSILAVLVKLISMKPLAEMATALPNFSARDVDAASIEINTFLGPLFRLSPINARVAIAYFPDPKDRTYANLQSSISSLRMETHVLQEHLFIVVNSIVRSSATARERILDYFATVVNKNRKRAALQVDASTTSSDGFMNNIAYVLNRLSEPFTDAAYSKIDRIDTDFFQKSQRIDISEETKLNSDEQTATEFYAHRRDERPNFISEVFFLNLAIHQYGVIPTWTNFERLSNEVREMNKHCERLQQEMPSWQSHPHGPLMRARFARLEQQIKVTSSLLLSQEVVLFDEDTQVRSFNFLMLASAWILRVIDPSHSYPSSKLELPLPNPPPEIFRNMPEYFVEILSQYFLFLSKYLIRLIGGNPNMELIHLSITFLRSSPYIKNPYLKAKLVETLFYGILPQREYPRGVLTDILNTHPFCVENLMPAVMSFYIEVEQTGESSSFYDKFNIRYHISQLIKCIWQNPAQRTRLADEGRNNPDFFVRFVALLLNDVTYLLDESLSKLAEIHNMQMKLEDGTEYAEDEQRQETEQNLHSAERQATSYMSLGNETVSMLKLFTEAIPDSFTMVEVVDRLAAMLDYNLDALVGPKCTSLKVRDPQRYRFDPKTLLSDIVNVYLNLRSKPAFVLAIARDGRSYKMETFQRAASILLRYSVRSSTDVDDLRLLVDAVEEARKQDVAGEEELGEVPDEFLDPLMFTVMEDPVVLPASKISIDRSTIKSHLLSDQTDPFNRSPLKLEDVIPDVDLKTRIEEFRAERKRGAQRMDTDG